MANPTPQVLIGSMKARILELERLQDLQLSRGANVGRNSMMDHQACFLVEESAHLLGLIRKGTDE